MLDHALVCPLPASLAISVGRAPRVNCILVLLPLGCDCSLWMWASGPLAQSRCRVDTWQTLVVVHTCGSLTQVVWIAWKVFKNYRISRDSDLVARFWLGSCILKACWEFSCTAEFRNLGSVKTHILVVGYGTTARLYKIWDVQFAESSHLHIGRERRKWIRSVYDGDILFVGEDPGSLRSSPTSLAFSVRTDRRHDWPSQLTFEVTVLP